MSIELKVYDNGDHTCLVWLPGDHKAIAACRGFAIERKRNKEEPQYLHGFVGFTDKDKFDPKKPWMFPLQRYLWWDYDVKSGDTVSYRIVPVLGKDKDHIAPNTDLASAWTDPPMKVTGQRTDHLSAYFNRGIVAAQWVSRKLDDLKQKSGSGKDPKVGDLIVKEGNSLREELSGLLRPEILSLLTKAKENKCKLFAALYELNDTELIDKLVEFGNDCFLILANGAFKSGKPDENKDVREKLQGKIHVFDRMVSSGHFAHNKFVVVCDVDRKPQQVLTGSTNWTSTGLCTQANNGLIIDDAAVAQDFLDAWDRYHAAGNGYPSTLAAANSHAKTFEIDGCKVTPWFVPTQHAEDLEYARKLINAAKDGILFLFFNPGIFQPQDEPEKWTLLQNVLNRHHKENNAFYNPNLYIKGVVNQEIPHLTNEHDPAPGKKPPAGGLDPTMPAHSVALYRGGTTPPTRLSHDVLVPAAIKDRFASWEKELLGAGVHVHSKVIVLDPLGENPVVMTGSHNLGFKASSKNDDNLVIVEGNAPLAIAYAINIIAIYQAYRWNGYVEEHRQDPKAWHGLKDTDQWQQGYLQGEKLAELQFWLGKEEEEPAAVAAVAAADTSGTVPSRPPKARRPHRVNSVSTRRPHGKNVGEFAAD